MQEQITSALPSYATYFQNKTVVATGGAGFVGSHLCEQLLAYGATVVAVDNLITGNKKNIEHLLYAKTDTNRFSFIEANVSENPEKYFPAGFTPDLILHFASPASPIQYQTYPVETYLVNSMGTHQLLQYILSHSPQTRFLFASTSEVYGDPQQHPQTESYWGNVNPNGIRSCYDEAKRLGETICGVHSRNFSLDVRIVRIFNTYGPKMSAEDGRIIPDFVAQALQNKPVTVFGDGSQTRSFCYVSDLVDGVLRLAASDAAKGETVNIGNPGEYTVIDTAKLITQTTGSRSKIEFKELPKDDPLKRRPDISKAKQLLDWEPKVDFPTGLQQTIEWFKKELAL
jgi:nucleoside-diphosphate-sugar epimerase